MSSFSFLLLNSTVSDVLYNYYFHSFVAAGRNFNSKPSYAIVNSRVRKQLVNVPSFIVRLDSQKHIDFSLRSPYGGGRPGRVKRKNMRKVPKAEAGGDDDAEEEAE